MKSKFLFPAWCSYVGYLFTVPGFVLGYFCTVNDYRIPGFGFKMREKDSLFETSFENLTNELAIFLVILGLILIAFSKHRKEDELNAKLRLNSLYWGVMTYYVFYIVAALYSVLFGEIPWLGEHMNVLNLFTPLLIFLIRFYYLRSIKKEQFLIKKLRFLPNKPFRQIGIVVTTVGFIGVVASILVDYTEWENNGFEIFFFSLIVGLMLWAFSKNKVEDEMMMQQRLESLQLAVYFNYAVLLLATILVYSFTFLFVLVMAQFSLLLFFVLRMEYVNYKNNQQLNTFEGELSHEK